MFRLVLTSKKSKKDELLASCNGKQIGNQLNYWKTLWDCDWDLAQLSNSKKQTVTTL
jgi:hypothetical protein